MTLKNSIFFKNLKALYKINLSKSNEVHNILISAIYNVFVVMNNDIDQARLQMCLTTATGEWLDAWGDFFNIPRLLNELDGNYSQRIIEETLEPKVTVAAIKRSAARWLNREYDESYTTDQIDVFEPWKWLMKPSQRGTLSGEAKLWSPDYWTYGVIDISLPDMSQLNYDLIAYLNTIKAAGVKMVWSTKPLWSVIISYYTHPKAYKDYWTVYNLYSKAFYKSFMIWNDDDFLGRNDSDYQSKLSDSPGYNISGIQTLWWDGVSSYRELPQVYHKIRRYEDSSITRLSDIALIIGKPYEETTIGDMLELELDNRGNTYRKGLLSGSLGSSQISSVSLTQVTTWLANSIRKPDGSPIMKLLYNGGFQNTLDELTARQRKFIYADFDFSKNFPDWMSLQLKLGVLCISPSEITLTQLLDIPTPIMNAFDWLSSQHLLDILGFNPDEITLEKLYNAYTPIINALIREAPVIDNVMAPIQITTLPSNSDGILVFTGTDARWVEDENGMFTLTIDVSAVLTGVFRRTAEDLYTEVVVSTTSTPTSISVTASEPFAGYIQTIQE